MKVHELISLLYGCDANDLVILAGDEEGNNFYTAESIEKYIYVNGDVYLRELGEDERDRGFGYDDLYHGDSGEKAVAIFP